MSTINDGGPAFPIPDYHGPNGQVQPGANGMSLRQWYAGQAMVGMLSYPSDETRGSYHNNCDPEGVARGAREYADALIAELEKESK